jgi:allophanate hydrolase subunit 2
MTTMTKTMSDATEYEKSVMFKLRVTLKDHSLQVGSYVAGMRNDLADQGGLVVLSVAESVAYDFDITVGTMNLYKELAEYQSKAHGPSQATSLRAKAESWALGNAIEIRKMLNEGSL